MSQIFTLPVEEKCEICNENMIMLQSGIYRCDSCGNMKDNY